jgi:hypothetical protein
MKLLLNGFMGPLHIFPDVFFFFRYPTRGKMARNFPVRQLSSVDFDLIDGCDIAFPAHPFD